MALSLAEQRQIENEMIFRRLNEKVGHNLEDLNKQNIKDNNPQLQWDDDNPLEFRCECSDENCDQRIALKLSLYNKIHKDRKSFLIKPGHQVKAIEEVVLRRKSYSVVSKKHLVEAAGKRLNKTSVDNS